jgi:hypothetical protein
MNERQNNDQIKQKVNGVPRLVGQSAARGPYRKHRHHGDDDESRHAQQNR